MLPAAQRYASFLDAVFVGLAEPSLPRWPDPIPELDLQSLWFAGEFGSEFTTTDGRRVAIRDFGVWNHAAGPDFTGCAVQQESGTLRGDIELDPDVRDWERHGHGANAAYEGVVLHLFTQAPEARMYTRTSQHREVMQVHLTPELLRDGGRPRRMAEARLGRCAAPLRDMNEAQVNSLLEAASQYRLQHKAERLHALVRIHGREQAIFQALANALGYRHNQRAFTVLAQRLPLRALLKQDSVEREALLFGVAGFLDSMRYEDAERDTRDYLRELWSAWWKQRHAYLHWLDGAHRPRWQVSGARPGNHPQRRLGALSAMLGSWKQVVAPLSADAWSRREFSDTLLALGHAYWDQHYTLLAETAGKAIALIGEARVQEILANVCYPLLVPDKAALWEEFTRLPAKLDNQKVRRASLRLFGEDEVRAAPYHKRLFHQQGLLQVYEDYCLEDDSACGECPFPEKLKEWKGGRGEQ